MTEKHEKNILAEQQAEDKFFYINQFIASQQIPIRKPADALAAERFYRTGIHVSGIDGVSTTTYSRTSPSSPFRRR